MFQDSDPVSGLGGWGDSSKDFEVQDGGFSNFELSYPAYHTLRRNFTLQPLVGDVGSPFISNPYADANASFTPAEVSKMVNGFVGDFEGMQAYMEGFMVRNLLFSLDAAKAPLHISLIHVLIPCRRALTAWSTLSLEGKFAVILDVELTC